MVIQNDRLWRKYPLANGTMGTEYDSLIELIRHLEAARQGLEDQIEELRTRLATAEGRPA